MSRTCWAWLYKVYLDPNTFKDKLIMPLWHGKRNRHMVLGLRLCIHDLHRRLFSIHHQNKLPTASLSYRDWEKLITANSPNAKNVLRHQTQKNTKKIYFRSMTINIHRIWLVQNMIALLTLISSYLFWCSLPCFRCIRWPARINNVDPQSTQLFILFICLFTVRIAWFRKLTA